MEKNSINVKDLINEAVLKKAIDIQIIPGREGFANIWFRSQGGRTKHQIIDNKEAMIKINEIFALAHDAPGYGSISTRQGVLDGNSGLLPPTLQKIRLQCTQHIKYGSALIMRLIPYSDVV